MVEVRPRQHFLGKKDTFSCLAISLDGILEYTEVGSICCPVVEPSLLHCVKSPDCKAVAPSDHLGLQVLATFIAWLVHAAISCCWAAVR